VKNTFIISGLLVSATANSAPAIKVAIIDTGIAEKQAHLCKSGHKDFTYTGLKSENNHGPNISGLIDKEVNSDKYCQVILKFWDDKSEVSSTHNSISALKEAIAQKVNFINYSAGGKGFNAQEYVLIEQALDMGITIVAAAGNEGMNLDEKCDFYPACYDSRIIVVGNLKEDGQLNPTSNYGSRVTKYIVGTNRCANSICLTGTSQATAVMTGTLIKSRLKSLKLLK
jgi:subtilisin family serine protease